MCVFIFIRQRFLKMAVVLLFKTAFSPYGKFLHETAFLKPFSDLNNSHLCSTNHFSTFMILKFEYFDLEINGGIGNQLILFFELVCRF